MGLVYGVADHNTFSDCEKSRCLLSLALQDYDLVLVIDGYNRSSLKTNYMVIHRRKCWVYRWALPAVSMG